MWGYSWKLRIINFPISYILNRIKCMSEFLNKINYVHFFFLQNIDSSYTDLYSSLKQIALLRKTDSLDSLIVTVLSPFTMSFCRWAHLPVGRLMQHLRYLKVPVYTSYFSHTYNMFLPPCTILSS